MTTFDCEYVPEFAKDKKHLKVDTIDEDLENFEKAFSALKLKLPDLRGPLPGLQRKGVVIPVYKVHSFRCKSMNKGSRSGVRVIIAYIAEQDLAIYIEIYKKNQDDGNCDEDRIVRHFKDKKIEDFLQK